MANHGFDEHEILSAIAEVCAELAAGAEILGVKTNMNMDVTLNGVTYRINVDVVDREERDAVVH